MMLAAELQSHFLELGLVPDEAAQLLSVSPRTVQRWAHGLQEIPGPTEYALRAWRGLHDRALPWRPDKLSIALDDEVQIAATRAHAIELDALLKRVEARGGPAAPWKVDLDLCKATLGPLQVSFYKLLNGGFAPQSYRRSDGLGPDLQRDGPLLEDAYACIAGEFVRRGLSLKVPSAFTGPSLESGRLALWDNARSPPVVAAIDCQSLRTAFGLDPHVSDAKCRVLVRGNVDLLAEVAEQLLDEGGYTVKDFGMRVVELGVPELLGVADRFSLSTLNTDVIWGVR